MSGVLVPKTVNKMLKAEVYLKDDGSGEAQQTLETWQHKIQNVPSYQKKQKQNAIVLKGLSTSNPVVMEARLLGSAYTQELNNDLMSEI